MELVQKAKEVVYSNSDTSYHYLQKAIPIARELNNPYLMGEIENATGIYFYVKGDYPEATHHYIEASNTFLEAGYLKKVGATENNIALILMTQHEYDRAIKKFKKSIEMVSPFKDSVGITRSVSNIGISYFFSDRIDSAEIAFKQALNYSERLDNRVQQLRNHSFLGEVYRQKKKYDQALHHLQKSEELVLEKEHWELAFLRTNFSLYYLDQGNYNLAVQSAEKALYSAQKIGAKWEFQRIHQVMAESFEKLGQFENALTHHKLFKAYNDSVFSTEKETEINKLQLTREELKNATLRAENESIMRKAEQSQFFNIILFSSLFFVLSFIAILYRNRKQQTKFLDELAQNNSELRKSSLIIKKRNNQLDALNVTKNKILQILAHDLRSPLSSLHAMLELLENDFLEEQERKALLSRISNDLSITASMMDNLLAWGQKEFKEIKPVFKTVNVHEVIKQPISQANILASKKNIAINYSQESRIDAPRIRVDFTLFEIVLRNVLMNAIKYSHPGGSIFISCKQPSTSLALIITDQGIGMTKNQFNKLFTDHLESQSGTQSEKGTGIGLSMSREFMRLMGGELRIKSEYNEGTTVSLYFPMVNILTLEETLKESSGFST